ncbi:uncharacterized protein JCM10292_007685 [Rhodotorula paludigena]|uniref:uncharacterized protein n=1 Tax=Rhodotorula paludigena TaxID=86838 RepID=UPI0031813A43
MSRLRFDGIELPRRSRSQAPTPQPRAKREASAPEATTATTTEGSHRAALSSVKEEDDEQLALGADAVVADQDDKANAQVAIHSAGSRAISSTPDSGFAASDNDEPARKRQRTASEAAQPAAATPEAVKSEDEDVKPTVAEGAPETRKYDPRPEWMHVPGFNLFMVSKFPDMLKTNNEGKGTRPAAHEVDRRTYNGQYNFGYTGVGKPFLSTNSPRIVTDEVYSTWMGTNGNYECYGMCKDVWCGPALDGEFAALDNIPGGRETQKDVIHGFVEYLRKGNLTEYAKYLFDNYVARLDDSSNAEEFILDKRLEIPRATLEREIERSLRANRDLPVGYAVVVYVRPPAQAELADVLQLRQLRLDQEAAEVDVDAARAALAQAEDDEVAQAEELLARAEEEHAAASTALKEEKAVRKAAAKKEQKEFRKRQRAELAKLPADRAAPAQSAAPNEGSGAGDESALEDEREEEDQGDLTADSELSDVDEDYA